MNAPLTLAILGSTGSIGRQALEVAARESGRVRVVALAAGGNLDVLEEQARAVRPELVALEAPADPGRARERLRAAAPGARIEVGPGAAARVAADPGAVVVLNGIVGAAGLAASLAALARGARVALANKETLVVGGPLVTRALAAGGTIMPVDSEHSAALQCLGGRPAREVARLTITASGGPLLQHRDWRAATVEEVLAHPVWSMGPRITVDSALLVNKGFELIEAQALFGLGWDQLDAVLHPQALVHAMATFTDGSTVLQAAAPDMRLPIQLALSWPERWGRAVAPLAPARLAALAFEPIPPGRHPAFDLVLAAGRAGGVAPCAVNAADEVAVRAFLDGAIALGQIPEILQRVLDSVPAAAVESLAQLEDVDRRARELARAAVVAA